MNQRHKSHYCSTYTVFSFLFPHSCIRFLPSRLRKDLQHHIQIHPPSTMTSPLLPPLLALPTELKLQIFCYLKTDERPSLMILRRTHSSLRGLISREDCMGHNWAMQGERLFYAEQEHPYLIPAGYYSCYYCKRVLSASHFSEYGGKEYCRLCSCQR